MRRARARGTAVVLAVLSVLCVEVPGSLAATPPPAVAAPAPSSSAPRSPDTPGLRTVVVTVRGRADLRGVRTGPRSARPQEVERRLRTTARGAQAPLLARLRDWRAKGKAGGFERLWISNSVRVTATPRVVRRIAARPDVLQVTPDRIRLVPALAPATPNQIAVQAPALWDLGQTGQGVVVASLDSGVDVTHPDLASRWRGGSNSWFDPYGQHPVTPTDLTGHGTGVTGVLVGGDAGGSTLGTAPGAAWIAARVFDDSGASSVTAVHQAFQWLLDPDGDPSTGDAPQVVNASWSIGAGPGCDLTFQPDVQALRTAGIVTVFAAGNFGPGPGSDVSPANYPEALSVGALGGASLISPVSSRGPSSCGGRARPFPDVVAPGTDVLTTDRYGLYQYLSGTSVAAPHAAGLLALLLGARPGLTAQEQHDLLVSTAVDLGDPGVDDTYGHGLLDGAAAYAALPPADPPDFALAVTPAAASVQAGSPAAFSVQVTPLHGFTGDVSLSATGVPAGVSAGFSPASVPGGSGVATLTLATDAGTLPGSFTIMVSGTGSGLTHDQPVSLEVTAPQPVDLLVFSTAGNLAPAGVADAPDDADLYAWDGSGLSRDFDASLAGLPTGADIDGLDRVDDTHFFVSFSADNTWVPGLGKVQDEDVVYHAAGTWSLWFDGTAHGLTSSGLDVDALSIDGGTLAFSTRGNVNPPGVSGPADDADVYLWSGSAYSRVWNATWHGLPKGTNLDGLARPAGGGDPWYFSFAPDTTAVPGLGRVQDEDVVGYAAGTWSVLFDGTAHGLGGSAGLDIDAFDLP